MNHKFYNKSSKEQRRIQVTIAICSIVFIFLAVATSIISGLYLIGFFAFIITLTIVAPFFDMPSLKKSGKMIYYSPLFIAERPENGLIKIHGGTLFDYFFVIDRNMNGKQRTNFIIQQYLEGLLSLMENYREDKDMKVRGTSYIINERTAEKLGFKIVDTDFLQKLIMLVNYFNIMVADSLAKNKLSFPKVNQTKTFETDIGQLLERKAYIERLNESLKVNYVK